MGSCFPSLPRGRLCLELHKTTPGWFSLPPELKYRILQHLYTDIELACAPNPFAVHLVSRDFIHPALINTASSLAIWHLNSISRLTISHTSSSIDYVDPEIQPSKHLPFIKQLHISVGVGNHRLHRLPPARALRTLPNLRSVTVIKDVGERLLGRAHPVACTCTLEEWFANKAARAAGYGWMAILEGILVRRAGGRREVARAFGPWAIKGREDGMRTLDWWADAVGVHVRARWEVKLQIRERYVDLEPQCIADLELDFRTKELRATIDGESAVFGEQHVEQFVQL